MLVPSVGGWIPDSRVIHMTFTGSKMELKVKAGDLRAVDRPLQCKLALEVLKSDPRVLQGRLEPAPAAGEVYATDGTDAVGPEAGATGFARAPKAVQSGAASGYRSGARAAVGGRGARASLGGAHAEFSSLFGGAAAGALGDGGGGRGGGEGRADDVELDSTQKHRKKKKKRKTVVVPVAAAAGEEGGGTVVYDLPQHVQCVEGKQCSPSLRLKVRHRHACTIASRRVAQRAENEEVDQTAGALRVKTRLRAQISSNGAKGPLTACASRALTYVLSYIHNDASLELSGRVGALP